MYTIQIKDGRETRMTEPLNGVDAWVAFRNCCKILPKGVQVTLIWDNYEAIADRYED